MPAFETGIVGPQGFEGDSSTWGSTSDFNARTVLQTQRFAELDRKQAFYEGTQHDYKDYDFDARPIRKGSSVLSTQAPLGNEIAAYFVPLRSRRPSAPYRLPKVIVDSFTSMTFGQRRFPAIRIEGDPKTQDYMSAMAEAQGLAKKMIYARRIGGSVGTVGLSWCFDKNGKPRTEVHNGKYLWVHSWEDRQEFIPRHVSQIQIYEKDEWDGKKGAFLRNWYWSRRDWMPDADLTFFDVKYEPGKNPSWDLDLAHSSIHNDGETHFQWIQNLPDEGIDGLTDYEGLWENFDALDTLYSVIFRGVTLNLDPTVVVTMDPEQLAQGLRRGSDNAMAVGEKGTASFLELNGNSFNTGLSVFSSHRASALETSQCVLADPDKLAAAGISSVALKVIFAPMIAKTDILRQQYGDPMRRMLDQQQRIARARDKQSVVIWVKQPNGEVTEEEAIQVVTLPPRVVRQPVLDDEGKPLLDENTGQQLEKVTRVEREIGEGGDTALAWPEYFEPTPTDKQATVTTLSLATGSKAIISQQTAVEQTALMFGHEPDEEWQRVQKMRDADSQEEIDKAKKEAEINASMFSSPDMGGKVDPDEDPSGASTQTTKEGGSADDEPPPPAGAKTDDA